MGQSPLLRKAHLLKTGLSLIRSLMGQSPLFSKAHLPETGLSPIHAESHGSVSPVVKCSFARGRLLSDPESHESALSVVQCSFAGDGPLSNPESHGSVSFAARCGLGFFTFISASRSFHQCLSPKVLYMKHALMKVKH